MAQIRFDNGITVNLSKETAKRLQKELSSGGKQLEVDKFRAVRRYNGFLFAIMKHGDDIWDGEMKVSRSNAKATHYLMRLEVERIIASLIRMLDE